MPKSASKTLPPIMQRTIRRPVHAIGIGVHSGEKVRMTLRPAEEHSGIRFVRTHLDAPAEVRASAQNVSDTTLSTSLADNGIQIATVEHLLSALWGLGVDNLVVELSSEEVPIMDGSAAPFIYLINTVGLVEQRVAKEFIRITRPIKVNQGDAEAALKPFMGFKASYTFVADHPVYNRYPKRAQLDFSQTSYVDQVSRARSFGLINELQQAQAINKCLGSSLENAVGIDDFAVLNDDGLRYQDEFVKHKLLDAIGDLYLLGHPILGEFEGYKSGHALNNKLARALLRCEDAWQLTTFGEEPRQLETPILQPAVI
ncbi:MAG: UDP-3-O-acyl-N-acetylglucosamine deacetylase [Pseudomonadales bacterium]|jgi:UDP-3-O-[3-hydroxymyristoyl] N-acetylglucosamine deacetylase|nr:UDP-3-O-acyl-N-acetylglucosamine deacetylase [Pseudomonadales bacterium]MDP6471758.1 UDP-3-O-acyl-N-acetylglucosamine deacetylase [Pseudomonadales bacterium]MDP6971410.1 UDP-3-O-acyl-N-acetylglucosamine deacetylase [Pseudomonadales bacterium]